MQITRFERTPQQDPQLPQKPIDEPTPINPKIPGIDNPRPGTDPDKQPINDRSVSRKG